VLRQIGLSQERAWTYPRGGRATESSKIQTSPAGKPQAQQIQSAPHLVRKVNTERNDCEEQALTLDKKSRSTEILTAEKATPDESF
jgi:hypothetical protein